MWLFVLAYNLGNFLRRLALPESLKRWSLTSVQTRLIKIGGRLVRHASRLVFLLAEVMVTRDMFDEMLERIGRLRLAPGLQDVSAKGIVIILRLPWVRCATFRVGSGLKRPGSRLGGWFRVVKWHRQVRLST